MTPEEGIAIIRERLAKHRRETPPFFRAIRRDAVVYSAYRGDGYEFRSRFAEAVNILRLAWKSEDFLGIILYRFSSRMRVRGLPVLPTLLNKICYHVYNLRIGDPVLIHPGIYIPHGNVIIDGLVEIGQNCTIAPFTTIGLRENNYFAPLIGDNVHIGTGAKIIGPVTVGDGAFIGAGAVVVNNVPPDTTVVGVPARPAPKGVIDGNEGVRFYEQ